MIQLTIQLTGRLSPLAARKAWMCFEKHHYDFGTPRQKLADNRVAFLALHESKVVAFAAAIKNQGQPGYRSHKIVTLPAYQHLWGEVADALAYLYASNGNAFSCIAPDSLTSYRLNNPHWEKRNTKTPLGCTSWKYIGIALAASA